MITLNIEKLYEYVTSDYLDKNCDSGFFFVATIHDKKIISAQFCNQKYYKQLAKDGELRSFFTVTTKQKFKEDAEKFLKLAIKEELKKEYENL